MKIKLCKIDKTRFDELKNIVVDNFKSDGILAFDDELIESYAIPVIVDGQAVEVEVDLDAYNSIVAEESFGYTKFSKIGMQLHKDLRSTTVAIPRNAFYEKELWAYLSMTVFKSIVKELRLRDDDKITENKIKQFYFNAGEISRTGLLFLWVMVDRLNSEDDFEITHTAFEFVDPVKAILERTMSKNPAILRAFVQGIINNDKNSLFKSDKFRSKVPSNISCYASVSMLDALEYDELVDVITEQQAAIIGINTSRKKKDVRVGGISSAHEMRAPVNTIQNSPVSLVDFFKSKGSEILDNRPSGCLWVIGDQMQISSVVEEAEIAFGIKGSYGVSKAAGNRAGWWTKESK